MYIEEVKLGVRYMASKDTRGAKLTHAGKAPSSACTCNKDDANRCSYEEQRNKRVAMVREKMKLMLQVSQKRQEELTFTHFLL
jgi:hypothetical protein